MYLYWNCLIAIVTKSTPRIVHDTAIVVAAVRQDLWWILFLKIARCSSSDVPIVDRDILVPGKMTGFIFASLENVCFTCQAWIARARPRGRATSRAQ